MDGQRRHPIRHEPATLSGVMQEAIGAGLRSRYKPEKEVPHQMLVLMMQINEDQRRNRETSGEGTVVHETVPGRIVRNA